ncbi:MAG: hypothetical protein OXB88_06670 [Bacteriovoracales bacterium]|nr:hypothetical protein [Bacteriovoracales bacterium]
MKAPNNKETREMLRGTPFAKAADLKKARTEIQKKTWEQLEKARIFSEISQKPEYEFIRQEFSEGLRCRYGDDKKHLVKVFSEGTGIQIDINKDLVKNVPQSSSFVETLIRSLGDTFSKSYYRAKGIIPPDHSLDDVIKSVQEIVAQK